MLRSLIIISLIVLWNLSFAEVTQSEAKISTQNKDITTKDAEVADAPTYQIRPAINGRPGVMRVFSADNFGGNTFAFSYHGEYYEDYDVPFPGYNQFYRDHIGLNAGITKFIEVFFERTSTVNNNDSYSYNNNGYYGNNGYNNNNNYYYNGNNNNSTTTISLGDMNMGAKLTIPLAKDFKLGVEGSVLTYTDVENSSYFTGTSYGIRGLATVNFGNLLTYNYPVLLHLNYQYLYNNSYDAVTKNAGYNYRYIGLTRYDRMNYGAALEVQAGAINPFIEYTLSQPMTDRVDYTEYPSVLTIGTKINPGEERRFSFNVGCDIGLTQNQTYDIEGTPRYTFLFGLAYIMGGDRKLASTEVKPVEKAEAVPLLVAKNDIDPKEELRLEIRKQLEEERKLAEAKDKEDKEKKEIEDRMKLAYQDPVKKEVPAATPTEAPAAAPAPVPAPAPVVAQAPQPQIYFINIPQGTTIKAKEETQPQVEDAQDEPETAGLTAKGDVIEETVMEKNIYKKSNSKKKVTFAKKKAKPVKPVVVEENIQEENAPAVVEEAKTELKKDEIKPVEPQVNLADIPKLLPKETKSAKAKKMLEKKKEAKPVVDIKNEDETKKEEVKTEVKTEEVADTEEEVSDQE